MSWISRITNALRAGRTSGDIEDELQFHLDQRIEDLVREGVPRNEAKRRAQRQLGNSLRLQESVREVSSAVWLESLLQDIRFGLRMIAKHRIASLAAILSLALAIGACTLAYTLTDALLFRTLPVSAPEELIDLARLMPAFFNPGNVRTESPSFSYAQYRLLRDTAGSQARIFAIIPGLQLTQYNDSGEFIENLRVEAISGGGFGTFGIRPAAGRLIQADDDYPENPDPAAVISYSFGKRRFGNAANALGAQLRLGRQSFTVIGVAPRGFTGVQPGIAWMSGFRYLPRSVPTA